MYLNNQKYIFVKHLQVLFVKEKVARKPCDLQEECQVDQNYAGGKGRLWYEDDADTFDKSLCIVLNKKKKDTFDKSWKEEWVC